MTLTQALYDTDYERDRLTVCQALLLMTFRHSLSDQSKSVRYWLNLLWFYACSIGLNRNLNASSLLTTCEKSLWKRVWWTFFERDTIVAVTLKQPLTIPMGAYTISSPDLDDFPGVKIPIAIRHLLRLEASVDSPDFWKVSQALFFANIRLSMFLSEMLHQSQEMESFRHGERRETTTYWRSTTSTAVAEFLGVCYSKIIALNKSQPNRVCGQFGDAPADTSMTIFQHTLFRMNIATALMFLQNDDCQNRSTLPFYSNMGSSMVYDRKQLYPVDAEATIISSFLNLLARDLLKYLPTTSIRLLYQCVTIHASQMHKSEIPEEIAYHENLFLSYLRLLKKLESVHNEVSELVICAKSFEKFQADCAVTISSPMWNEPVSEIASSTPCFMDAITIPVTEADYSFN